MRPLDEGIPHDVRVARNYAQALRNADRILHSEGLYIAMATDPIIFTDSNSLEDEPIYLCHVFNLATRNHVHLVRASKELRREMLPVLFN